MNAEVRRRIEMGTRAVEFSRANPDTEPGMQGAVSKLEQLIKQAAEAAAAQRDGIIQVRASAARKEELRHAMTAVPITHMAEVGLAAAPEKQELGTTFRLKPGSSTIHGFQTAAHAMVAAAEAHKETLEKHGMVQSLLDDLVQLLGQLDATIQQGSDGRAAHVGATAELKAVAFEIARTVRVMDGRNRQRFAHDPQLLGSWLNASRVSGRRRPGSDGPAAPAEGATPADGDVRPAA